MRSSLKWFVNARGARFSMACMWQGWETKHDNWEPIEIVMESVKESKILRELFAFQMVCLYNPAPIIITWTQLHIVDAEQRLKEILEQWHKKQKGVVRVEVTVVKGTEELFAEIKQTDKTTQWQRVDAAMSIKCSKTFDPFFIAVHCFLYVEKYPWITWLHLQGKRQRKWEKPFRMPTFKRGMTTRWLRRYATVTLVRISLYSHFLYSPLLIIFRSRNPFKMKIGAIDCLWRYAIIDPCYNFISLISHSIFYSSFPVAKI